MLHEMENMEFNLNQFELKNFRKKLVKICFFLF